jgi:hypothetical protein
LLGLCVIVRSFSVGVHDGCRIAVAGSEEFFGGWRFGELRSWSAGIRSSFRSSVGGWGDLGGCFLRSEDGLSWIWI